MPPRLKINSISVSAGHRKVTRKFSVPISGRDFDPGKRIRPLIDEVQRELGVASRKTITYNLTVDAVSKASAAARARAFTRSKNLTTPDIVRVVDIATTGGSGLGPKEYKIITEIKT